jgi:predicted DNA-binding ribbon-helix-helix protein
MTATTTEYLETYLQDHRAGAAMGSDLAHRLAEENAGTPYEDFLLGLAQEIDADVDMLEQVMDRFGVSKPSLKIAGAKVGERLGRLKPNEQLTGYSPLSRVLEIEGLRGGVQAKQGLWDSLAELAKHDDRLDPEQMAELQAKAQKQLDGLREQSRMAAHQAFVVGEDDE